jgi:transporter family-2 protein
MTIAAGLGGAVQVAVMARLGERIGVVSALAFAAAVAGLVAAAILLVVQQSFGGYAAALRQPPWLWIGGLLSLFIVLTITYAGSVVGTTATLGLMFAGNLAMGAMIDRFGWLGSQQIPLSWQRVLGILLLAVGGALTLRK